MTRTTAAAGSAAVSADPLGRTHWREQLVAEALATLESRRPLADADELAAAARATPTLNARITERAWRLAAREGLLAELAALRRLLWWPLLGCSLLVALSATGMLRAVVGEGRSINVLLALVAVLGLHAFTLLLWLLALVRGQGQGLGRWALKFTRRWTTPAQQALTGAALGLLQRARLLPWAFGAFSHAVWSAAFGLVLTGLLLAFSFQAFQLGWETTILAPDLFLDLIHRLGTLPAWLGLPTVTPEALAAADAPRRHRLLAWWLIGCTVAWGLLPRLLLLLLCGAVCAWRLRRLQPDASAPWVQRLATRFDQWQAGRVVDAERPPASTPVPPTPQPLPDGPWALLGFELPPEVPWPPFEPRPDPAGAPTLCHQVAGSADERAQALRSLTAQGVRRVLLVVDGGASPDRGSARFLQALQGEDPTTARAVGLLLLATPARLNERRWTGWLAEQGLGGLPSFTDTAAAHAWITAAPITG